MMESNPIDVEREAILANVRSRRRFVALRAALSRFTWGEG